MSFNIKHILTVDNDSTPEKVQELAEAFEKCTGFNLHIADDHCDDSNWNYGMGLGHAPMTSQYEAIGELFGEDFTVHCVGEAGSIYDIYVLVDYDEDEKKCYARVDEDIIRQTPEWYDFHKDDAINNPGVRKGYYIDYGTGENYPVQYGNTYIPAGVKWWELPENKL